MLKKILFVLSIIVIQFTASSAEPLDTLWSKSYGGAMEDFGFCGIQTDDLGYLITGNTQSFGNGSDLYLLKTDSEGDSTWMSTFGMETWNWGNDIIQTYDGGYVMTGVTHTPLAGPNLFLGKADIYGSWRWTRDYGANDIDVGNSIFELEDYSLLVTGISYISATGGSKVYLMKTDDLGIDIWQRIIGENYQNGASSIIESGVGNYLLAGWTSDTSYVYDAYILKVNADGDTIWTKTYGGEESDDVYNIEATPDGGYVAVGKTRSYGAGEDDIWILKLDSEGDTLWTQTYGTPDIEVSEDVCVAEDGGLLILGNRTFVFTGFNEVFILKTDMNGNFEWEQVYSDHPLDFANSLRPTDDGGYILTGSCIPEGQDYHDIWLLRLDAELSVIEEIVFNQPDDFVLHPAYPNPFNPSTMLRYDLKSAGEVKLSIYDVTGREVATLVDGYKPSGSYNVKFEAENLSSGMYLALLNCGGRTYSQKMLLVK